MPKYNTNSNVPLSLAVWLATDTYDYNSDPCTISATSLLKPTRQLILSTRMTDPPPMDITNMVASRMGTAIHDSIEKAWNGNIKQILTDLGYANKVADMLVVNPPVDDPVPEGKTAVYMEQRLSKTIGKFTVTGKFDFLMGGRLEDFKSTSVWTYMTGSNDEKYALQGSIYRWIRPDLITSNMMDIQFIFTDWSAARASIEKDKGYPPSRTITKSFALKDEAYTEALIRHKLDDLVKYHDTPENELPLCSEKDLWRKSTIYKYYKNPEKRTRATRNFDNLYEAQSRLIEDGSVGVIDTVKGKVTACHYCPVFDMCSQKDSLINEGSLKL